MTRSIINIIQIWMTELREIMHDKGILIFIIFVPLCYPLLLLLCLHKRGGA